MNQVITGIIYDYDGTYLTIKAKFDNRDFVIDHAVRTVEIRINDGLHISAEQRKKIYATFKDIAEYTGYEKDHVKDLFKVWFCRQEEIADFSLSDCEMVVAGRFIDYLLDWCIEHGVELSEPASARCDDLERMMYSCLLHKKCCVCGAKADLHHYDAIGMGADRETMHHRGHRVMALCRDHHKAFHDRSEGFCQYYHVVPVMINEKVAKKYKVKY
jgi:hypothetical protein